MVNSAIGRRSSLEFVRKAIGALLYISPAQAAASVIYAATVSAGGGYITPYWGPAWLLDPFVGPYTGARSVKPSEVATDVSVGARLWVLSKVAVGLNDEDEKGLLERKKIS